MRLLGKIAVVTGGSSGIGQATAERFAKEGAIVAVTSGSDISRAQAVVDAIRTAGGQAVPIQMDVRSPAAIKVAFDDIVRQLGPVDILVNAAGITRDTTLRKMTPQQWHDVLDKIGRAHV